MGEFGRVMPLNSGWSYVCASVKVPSLDAEVKTKTSESMFGLDGMDMATLHSIVVDEIHSDRSLDVPSSLNSGE